MGELKAVIGRKTLKIEVEDLLDGSYQIKLLLPEKEWAKIREKGAPVNVTFQRRSVWKDMI